MNPSEAQDDKMYQVVPVQTLHYRDTVQYREKVILGAMGRNSLVPNVIEMDGKTVRAFGSKYVKVIKEVSSEIPEDVAVKQADRAEKSAQNKASKPRSKRVKKEDVTTKEMKAEEVK